jgi:hypothetical protein
MPVRAIKLRGARGFSLWAHMRSLDERHCGSPKLALMDDRNGVPSNGYTLNLMRAI